MYQNSDLLEMEAHVPCKSLTPVYIPKMNHNSSANGSERNHNLTSDQILRFNKEVFRQTMLNQEMIFKNQIMDLHCLYGRQRELMGITRNELDKHNLSTEASTHTTSLSQTSLVCTQKTFNISACSQLYISGAESIQSPSCFVQKRNIHPCSNPVQTEDHSGDHGSLKSKCKKSRKNLDLRLPPDTIYIDCEEEELLEDGMVSEVAEVSSYPIKKIPEVVCNCLASNGFKSVPNYASSAASLEKSLVDLNCLYELDEESAPTSDSFVGPTGIEVYSSILLQGTKSKQELLSSYNYNAGKIQSSFNTFPQGFHADNLSLSSDSLHKKPKQHEPSSFLHNYQNPSSERATIGVQIFRRYSGSKGDHQSGPSGALMCTASQHIPRDCLENSGSSCFTGLRKPIHDLARTPVVDTSIPLSNNRKSSILRPGLEEERLQLKKHLRSSTKCDGTVADSSYGKGFYLETNKSGAQPPSIGCDNLIRVNEGSLPELHGMTRYTQDSANVIAQKDIDLNFMPSSCSLDVAVSQSFQTLGTEKHEGFNERFPLHRPKVDYYGKTDKGCEDSNQAEASDFSGKRVHGSSTCETPNMPGDHCYHVSSSNHLQKSVQGVHNCKRAVLHDLNVPYHSVHVKEAELTANEHVEKSNFEKGGFGVHIDLNSSINDVEFGVQIDLNASINEVEFSAISSPSTESLLEAPASPENKECSPPRGVSSDGNQVDTPDLMSGPEAPEDKEFPPPTRKSDKDHAEIPFPSSVQEGFEHKVCAQPTESDEKVDMPCPLSVHKDLEHMVCYRPTESDEQIERPFALSGQGGLQNKEYSQPIEFDENQIETPLPLSNVENKDCSQPMDSDDNQFETQPSGLDDLELKDCSQPMYCDENQILTPLPLSGQDDLETKDCSQPMDSTEKQICTPVLLSRHDVHLEEEMFRTAAECLVSISSSVCHTCSGRTTNKPTKSKSNSLKWFAGVASSVLGSLENKVGCDDDQVVLPDGMDYFEAMTLMLPESRVEEICCYRDIRSDYKEEVMVTASSQSQPKKGRPRKGEQRMKNFQKEVLSGLESLSRCEVSEDLQIIGTLIEASADCSKTRSVRPAAKFGLTKLRRKCTISASNVKENTAASPLTRIGVKRQLEREKRSLIDWGGVTRRPRGQRNPGSKV